MAASSSNSGSAPSTGFLSSFFGQKPANDGPNSSVLAEWNKYSNDSAGPSGTGKVLGQMEEGRQNVGNFLSSSYAKVSAGAQGVGASVNVGMQQFPSLSTTSLTYFFALLGTGLLFLILAFTLFLPVVMLAPSKFAVCFTLGSLCTLSAFMSLRGWRGQLGHMFSSERLPFTAGYLGSMIGTLWAALHMHSYVLSIIFCIAQFVALLYYCLSYFPGGTAGVRFMLYLVAQGFMQCFASTLRMVGL